MRYESNLQQNRRVLAAGIEQREQASRVLADAVFMCDLLLSGSQEHVTMWTRPDGHPMHTIVVSS